MKLKYYTLNKNEQLSIKNEFYNTKLGKYIKRKLFSSLICGILCMIISIYVIIDNYLNNKNIWEYVYGISLLCIGITFIIITHKVRIKKINNYLVKNKK